MSEHARTEMRIWLGFGVSFLVAFLATVLMSQRSAPAETIEVAWILAVSTSYINHAFWHRYLGTAIAGSLGIASSPPFDSAQDRCGLLAMTGYVTSRAQCARINLQVRASGDCFAACGGY